jgi:hypothetical protein
MPAFNLSQETLLKAISILITAFLGALWFLYSSLVNVEKKLTEITVIVEVNSQKLSYREGWMDGMEGYNQTQDSRINEVKDYSLEMYRKLFYRLEEHLKEEHDK